MLILTVASVWNTVGTGDIYALRMTQSSGAKLCLTIACF